jgi:hypothetical protein
VLLFRKHTENLQADKKAEEERMRQVEIEAIAKHSRKEDLKRKEMDRVVRETQVKRKVASTQFSAELMACATEVLYCVKAGGFGTSFVRSWGAEAFGGKRETVVGGGRGEEEEEEEGAWFQKGWVCGWFLWLAFHSVS